MPLSDEALRRYRLLLHNYRARTAALLASAWDDLGSYEEEDIDRFVTVTAPALAGAKVAAVGASAGFFALALGIRPVAVNARNVLVEPRVKDPFLAAWHAVNEGRPWEEAVVAGRNQAEAVGADFVQRTARRTGDVVAEASGQRVRWRRIPEPGACAWCRTIARQMYRSAESADFGHDRCFCDVVPAA